MTFLSDDAIEHLQEVAGAASPHLEGARYRTLEEIGHGGMGTVYRAEDRELDRSVALKVLHDRLLQDPCAEEEATDRLRQEARVLARLEHPGIVPVHDVGLLPDGRTFYTMKWVQGQRLDSVLAGETSLSHRLRIFERLCEAVAFAHDRGIVHRDLKPENVMVGPFGEVLVMDWGVAKVLSRRKPEPSDDEPSTSQNGERASPERAKGARAGRTEAGVVLGTPGYMAPEQAAGAHYPVDGRADVYALGGLLRYLLTGRHPWQAQMDNDRQERTVPKQLEAVVARALEGRPEDRYQTVMDLSAEISQFLMGAAVTAYRETFGDRVLRFYRRHRVAILLVAAYLLMRVLLFAFAGF